MKRRPQKERQGIQSVELGYRVLAAIADNRGPLSLRELSQRAAMPASKVHRYLVSFIRCGLAEQDPTTNRYDLGAGSLALGLAALNRQNAIRFTTAAAIELNQRFDITVFVTVWGNRGPVVIGMYDSSEMLVSNMNVGTVLPVMRSATGQLYLAYLPRAATRKLVERENKDVKTHSSKPSIQASKDIERIIRRVRKNRMGTTYGELIPTLSAAAAAILDHEGRIVVSVGMLGVLGTLGRDARNPLMKALLATADDLSRRLGYSFGGSFAQWLEEGNVSKNPPKPPSLIPPLMSSNRTIQPTPNRKA